MENPLLNFSNQVAAVVSAAADHVVAIDSGRRISSSGVIWAQDLIVTADHALKRHEDLRVTLPSGDQSGAELLGRDPGTDLAILRAENLPVPAWSFAAVPKPGQLAVIAGRGSESGTHASLGVLSAVSGEWRTWRGGRMEHYIRLDVGQYPGTSGAAVLNAAGELIGIATGGLSRIAALAIPTATITRVVAQLLEKGHVGRGFLGVGLQPVPLPDRFGIPQPAGVIVLTVEPDGPAEKAGLLLGDVIVTIDGHPVTDTADVLAALDAESIGRPVTLDILRGGERRTLTATVGERPRN